MHKRGATTAGLGQKSYKINLLKDKDDLEEGKADCNLLGLREDNDWILYSPYSDYEKVRNVFSMNLWRESFAGDNIWKVDNATEYKYLELFVNGHYQGLYALGYPIDRKQLGTGKGEKSESTFKKLDWSESEWSEEAEVITYEDGSQVSHLPGYAISNEGATDAEDLHELYAVLAFSEDPEAIRSVCDVDNGIDLWLYYELTLAVDNMQGLEVKNLYATLKRSGANELGYKLLLTPWDMDQSWGCGLGDGSGDNGISYYYYDATTLLDQEWGPVPSLINAMDEDILSELKNKYIKLRKGAWSEDSLMEMLDEYEAEIYDSGAFARTAARWPEGNYNGAEERLTNLKEYVRERLTWMDGVMEGL